MAVSSRSLPRLGAGLLALVGILAVLWAERLRDLTPFGTVAATPAILAAVARLRTGEEARHGQPWTGSGSGAALPVGVALRVPLLAPPTCGRPRVIGRRRVSRPAVLAAVIAFAAFLVLAAGNWSTCADAIWWESCGGAPVAEGGPARWLGFYGWVAVLTGALAVGATSAMRRQRP